MPDVPATDTVQSVDRALQILQLLTEQQSMGASDIARQLGVHRSTAFRLLATLESHGYVEQEMHRGQYRLGLGVLRLAGPVTQRVDLARDAQVVCDHVAADFNETANVAILAERAAVNITQTMSGQLVAVRRQYVGQRTPLHATSTGKILLAHAPTTLCESILAAPLERFTDATITEPAMLREELSAVRAQGWAAADAEWEPDAVAVAVPVHDAHGQVVAALSVTAPSFRMPRPAFAEVANRLRASSTDLSHRLGYLPPASA